MKPTHCILKNILISILATGVIALAPLMLLSNGHRPGGLLLIAALLLLIPLVIILWFREVP